MGSAMSDLVVSSILIATTQMRLNESMKIKDLNRPICPQKKPGKTLINTYRPPRTSHGGNHGPDIGNYIVYDEDYSHGRSMKSDVGEIIILYCKDRCSIGKHVHASPRHGRWRFHQTKAALTAESPQYRGAMADI